MLAAHRALLANTGYMPKLPWKKGERDAFRTIPSTINDLTIPIFVVPPAGDFDHEIGHIPTPAEHVLLFGPRLFECRTKRPVFIDAVQLDDKRHRIDPNVHPLTALLERARLAGALAWPLTASGRSDEYQEAVARAHLRHQMPVALQISLAELDAPSLAQRLTSLCNQVSCDPADAILIIDAGSIAIAENDESLFAKLLIHKINELPNLYQWHQIVFCATALSNFKIGAGEEKTIRRLEWHIYRLLQAKNDELYRTPIFADYGVEFIKDMKPNKARPSAKINYTKDGVYFFVKGQNVKQAGYEAIYPVAETVVASPGFKGASFSRGDARMVLLSERKTGTGNAPVWKWAAVDHHLNMVGRPIAKEMGMALEAPDVGRPADLQRELFQISETTPQSR
jgi:hypothetical protein